MYTSGMLRSCRRCYLARQSSRLCFPVSYTPQPSRYLSTTPSSQSQSPSPASIDKDPEQSARELRELKASRLENINNVFGQHYPRISLGPHALSCKAFRQRYDHVASNSTVDDTVVLHGRVQSFRQAGGKLMFIDILHEGSKVQVLCNQKLLAEAGVDAKKFKDFAHVPRRGDSFSITGKPHRTGRGELSIQATELPQLLSPCLDTVPVWKHESEDTDYPRHVELLASPTAASVLRARSIIVQTIRQFFLDRSFLEVNTPILAAAAGGAVARPFKTHATEFPEETLSLRIAPELWLKRLVVSGFDKVFEIGSSFRNEAIDRTHNPEFTTCEFYQAFADLDALMATTETLLRDIAAQVKTLNESLENSLSPPTADFTAPFKRIDFIPAIEAATGRKLPDLESDTATADIHQLFADLEIPVPDDPTLARLLDKLAGHYLEPQCENPTFIMNHPECLSPLSKSFIHPDNGQKVSARAELFIEGREVVNLYEEENSPIEQRKKFQRQLDSRDPENASGSMDEKYLEVLEWGLPPTGGWGCGIDRLTMLFTGAKRIDDVLSFGNLRNVTKASK